VCACFRNHQFDERKGDNSKKRKASNFSLPFAPSKGARGIREHHRLDETKVLPHVRLGIDIIDIE
jgi:hypothetical protein